MTFSSGGQEQTFSSASDSKFQETTATKTQQSTNFSSSEFTGNILIGVEYGNFCRTLNFYLLFAIWMEPKKSKLI